LRHVSTPFARFLKQVLKHSRFLPVLFKAVARVLRPRRKFSLPDLTSIFSSISTPEWPVTAFTISSSHPVRQSSIVAFLRSPWVT
jgi:hypothetical protein